GKLRQDNGEKAPEGESLDELNTLDGKNRELERAQIEGTRPKELRVRDLKIARAAILIASGKDENVENGEKQLAELILENPALQRDRRFHETVLKSYVEMAT